MPRRAPVSSDKRFRKQRAGGDHGTDERWQHSGRTLVLTERAGIMAARATEEHVLDHLCLSRQLDGRQARAAWQLKEDFHRADLAARTVSSYSGVAGTRDAGASIAERTPLQEAAYRRWRAAVADMSARCGGPAAAAVCATVCHDAAPTPAGLRLLQDALARLADWYRIVE